jgi:two-component system, OmpR family, sensor histidine kinase BaeS
MFSTLRARLFLASTAVLVCAVVLELALIWHEVGGYFVATPAARVSTSLSRADGLLGTSVIDPADRPVLLHTLTRLVANVGGGFAFLPLPGTGDLGFHAGAPVPTARSVPLSVEKAVLSGSSWSGLTHGGSLSIAVMPAIWGGRVQGTLVWQRPVAGRNLARALLLGVLGAGLAALLFGMLLWAWESRRITQPLDSLAEVARRIAEGELSVRADVKSPREFVALSGALSSLAMNLEKSDVARREFQASVAHELRTPLTALRGYLEALGDGTVPADREESYRTKCLDEVSRLNRLLDDLLDMAKSEAGRLDLAIRPILLGETMSRAILLWESAIRQKDLVVEVDLPAQPVVVEADADRVMQIMNNLLANAVSYTPAGGRVAFGLRTEGDWAIMSLTDSGPGIPPEQLPRIFDRYYRFIPGGRMRGTGLGLAIVRTLAEAHGGRVTAASSAGETRFEVYLPVRSPLVAGHEQGDGRAGTA